MFLPVRDDNPHVITPVVTWVLIATNVCVFLWQQTLSEQGERIAILAFGLIPADLFGTAELNPAIAPLPAWMTIFTSMFMHGGWMHLIGNMLYLWIFGDNVEASMGRGRYLLFYLICGLAAALTQSVSAPGSTIPMVGASGAVAGVLGAYLILHPHANIRVFVWIIVYISVINVPAYIVLGFWFIGQLLNQLVTPLGAPGVAFLAHIGGFIAGAVLVFKFRKPGVPVFTQRVSRPFEMSGHRIDAPHRSGGSVPPTGAQPPPPKPTHRKGPWG